MVVNGMVQCMHGHGPAAAEHHMRLTVQLEVAASGQPSVEIAEMVQELCQITLVTLSWCNSCVTLHW
jgi:hypothetical protein